MPAVHLVLGLYPAPLEHRVYHDRDRQLQDVESLSQFGQAKRPQRWLPR